MAYRTEKPKIRDDKGRFIYKCGKIVKICARCSTTFESYSSNNKNYCSKSCASKVHTPGRIVSEETRKRMSEANHKRFVDKINHPRWIADRTKLAKKQERNDSAYKEWRKSVRDRDDWRCQMSNDTCLGKVIAHHILPWSKFPELRYEVNNGITLCTFHHPRKRADEMRLSPYFQDLVGKAH